MDISLNNVIVEICNEYGVDVDIGNKIIHKLNDQFFFRLSDIVNMNFEIWKSLELPLNLFFILQQRLNQVKTQGIYMQSVARITPIIQETKSPIPDSKEKITQPLNLTRIQTEKEKGNCYLNINLEDLRKSTQTNEQIKLISESIAVPKESPKKETTENLLEIIVTELNIDKVKDPAKIDTLKKLHTILSNIAANPNEDKFKKLKINSKFYMDYLHPYKSILNYLNTINFKYSQDNQFLEYKGDLSQINLTLNSFNQFLLDKRIVQSDPYATSIISTGTNPNELKKLAPKEDLAELLRKEKQRREEIVRNSKTVERKAKIFLTKDDSVNALIQSLSHEDELDTPKPEEQEFFKKAMVSINENTERFVMRTRTELENLIKKPVYTKATIRVKFPNQILFQSNFAMMETIEDVYKTIIEILSNPNEQFYFFIPFPSKKFTEMKATIHSQNLAPSTLVYIAFPNIDPMKNQDYQYIKSEYLEKFKTEYKY